MSSRRSESPWRRAAVRSRSLPRVISSTAQKEDGRGDKRAGGVSAWAPGWLLTPQQRKIDKTKRPESKQRRPLLRRTPFLTLLLIRLDDCMQSFCENMADPTVKNAAAASAILEAAAMTASSPTSSPSSASTSNNTSPSPASPRNTVSERAIEGECQKYVSPLLLLAGAEAIFSNMEHVLDIQQFGARTKLVSLYQKIEDDLDIVKETLCRPFMSNEAERKPISSPEKQSQVSTHIMSNKAASSLTIALDTFMVVTSIRRELLMLHHDVFLADSEKDLLELSVRCRSLLKDMPESSTQACGAVLVMIQSIKNEIKAMAAALAAAYHLKRCCFLETVLNAKVLKVHMRAFPSTTLQMWFHRTLKNLLCIMAIFFDRIDAFSSPLYGFDKSRMVLERSDSSKKSRDQDAKERVGLIHDYDSSVLEFLRRHQSKGGSPMAVGIVLDAVQASCFHVGRGYENEERNLQTLPEQFPAVYMRTTVHSISGSSSSTLSSGVRGTLGIASNAFRPSQKLLKSSSRREVPEDEDHASSLRLSWSGDGGTPKNRKRKDTRANVLEYPPDSGMFSWPHVEWETLASTLSKAKLPNSDEASRLEHSELLIDTTLKDNIQIFRPSEPTSQESDCATEASGEKESINGMSPPRSALSMPWVPDSATGKELDAPFGLRRSSGSSVHHVKRLNEYMWLVVMVKEEESRWNLRRSRGSSDEDIHVFLHDLSLNLSLERLFLEESVATASKKVKSSGNETHMISLESYSTVDDYMFLSTLKKTFGLRPQSPMIPSLRMSPYQVGFLDRRPRRSLLNTASTQSYADELFSSAVVFFFGQELASFL